MKIDRERTLAVLQETGSVPETAKTLGIHVSTVRQIVSIHKGICVRCNAKTAPQRTMCSECLTNERTRMKGIRKARVRAALCIQCGEPRCPHSRLYCDKHRMTAAERNMKHHVKKRSTEDRFEALRGAPWGSARNFNTKMRRLLERYGRAGQERWDHAKGRCEACGAKYGDVAIHIHHVDEDKSNGAFDNLACICFDCHHVIHRLLSSKNRVGLIRWFEATYRGRPLR